MGTSSGRPRVDVVPDDSERAGEAPPVEPGRAMRHSVASSHTKISNKVHQTLADVWLLTSTEDTTDRVRDIDAEGEPTFTDPRTPN